MGEKEIRPYDVPNRPAFRFRSLEADCQDCLFRVADRNGALVVGQLEAHANSHPGHVVELIGGEYDPPERVREEYGRVVSEKADNEPTTGSARHIQ